MPIPKEKARRLVFELEQRIEQECNQSSREAHYRAAVKCAIIVVKEQLVYAQALDVIQYPFYEEGDIPHKDFLQQVLDELNKL